MYQLSIIEYRSQDTVKRIAVTVYTPELSTLEIDYSICVCAQSYPNLSKLGNIETSAVHSVNWSSVEVKDTRIKTTANEVAHRDVKTSQLQIDKNQAKQSKTAHKHLQNDLQVLVCRSRMFCLMQ